MASEFALDAGQFERLKAILCGLAATPDNTASPLAAVAQHAYEEVVAAGPKLALDAVNMSLRGFEEAASAVQDAAARLFRPALADIDIRAD